MNLHRQSGTVPSGDYARHRRGTLDHRKHDVGQSGSGAGFRYRRHHARMPVAGAGIPSGATVASVGEGTLTLSANATATAAGVSLTVGNSPLAIGEIKTSNLGLLAPTT
ncbi:MAG: hypothetical protein JOZ33_11325 [Acidobacteriaceae bacterium]|nr:hypothetical protein [Acidobacteriaceae bacterium]